METDDFILTQSLQDLAEDLELLREMATSGRERLRRFRTQLASSPTHFQKDTRIFLMKLLEEPEQLYKTLQEELKIRHDRLAEGLALKQRAADALRSLHGICAGIITAPDWQSPSYDHSLISQAGRETGKIIGTSNDYKRDHHADAAAYEKKFAKEYIDGVLRAPVRVFATGSGMAAVSTVAVCLKSESKNDGIVLAGAGTYFENKNVLRQIFGERLRFTDEMDIPAILKIVAREKPQIIFLDTLCNTDSMAMPDLARLIPALAREVKRPTFLVLDNSALSVTFQPLSVFPRVSPHLCLIVIESLNKFHQYGFDRVTGGIIWTQGSLAEKIFRTRMHLGTNIPDASALALPEPNRAWLEKRLTRIGRNTRQLAEACDERMRYLKKSPFEKIIYPGLPSYPGYAWTQKQKFHGGFFVFSFKPKFRRVGIYQKFLEKIMQRAKQEKVGLIAGTSFGLDVTRIYLTALHASRDAEPFIRVSVGTETLWELEQLKRVFLHVIKHF